MDDDLGEVNLYGVYPTSNDTKDGNPKTNDNNDNNNPQTITIFTGDSKDPVLANVTQHALRLAAQPQLSLLSNSDEGDDDPPNHVILGGTASKFVVVAQTPVSLAVLHFQTCYWDTCATEAVLQAKGGEVTDLFGTPLMHKDDQTYDYGNLWGVIASAAGNGAWGTRPTQHYRRPPGRLKLVEI